MGINDALAAWFSIGWLACDVCFGFFFSFHASGFLLACAVRLLMMTMESLISCRYDIPSDPHLS